MILQDIIKDIYSKIEEFEDKDDNQEFTFCFRGEAEDYKATKLTPTLFREKKIGGSLPDKELINLITDYKIVDDKNLNPLSKAIEGQHFLALSRLLDITFSILPSIFLHLHLQEIKMGIFIFLDSQKPIPPVRIILTNIMKN